MSLIFSDKYLANKPVNKIGFRTISTLAITISIFSIDESWALCAAPSSTLNFPTPIIVQRDTPVGAVLATANVVTTITCDGTGNVGTASWFVFPAATNIDNGPSTISEVRRTNIPGIGIRWSNHSDNTGTISVWTRKSLNDGSGARGIFGTGNSVFTDTFELIKIGDVTSTVSPSWVLDYAYRGSNNINRGRLYSNTARVRDMQVVACSVTNTSIPINMGLVKISEFSGIGSTSRENSFEIPLDCDANTKVTVRLDGTMHSSGAAGVLALNNSPEPVATGVGLQLLYNNAPVAFGTPIAAGTAASDGAYSIPFIARYYKTAGVITEGNANSTATFTMSYQ